MLSPLLGRRGPEYSLRSSSEVGYSLLSKQTMNSGSTRFMLVSLRYP